MPIRTGDPELIRLNSDYVSCLDTLMRQLKSEKVSATFLEYLSSFVEAAGKLKDEQFTAIKNLKADEKELATAFCQTLALCRRHKLHRHIACVQSLEQKARTKMTRRNHGSHRN